MSLCKEEQNQEINQDYRYFSNKGKYMTSAEVLRYSRSYYNNNNSVEKRQRLYLS